MNAFADRPALRWVVPVTAVAVIGAGSLLLSQEASADAGLAPRTAAQLLVDVQGAAQHQMSGTVTQKVDLGLPELPSLSGGNPTGSGSSGAAAAGGAMALLSGTHTWRVWVGAPTQSRLALLDGSHETDLIRNGQDVWLWSSSDKSAVHDTSTPRTAPSGAPTPADLPKTPQEAAQRALAALDPTTSVTTSGTAVVAGRQAHELVLSPKAGGSRVAQVRIAVDATTSVPLRVEVFSAKRANPAIDVGFTSVDFSTPDPSRFTFTAPPGTTVTEGTEGTDGASGVTHDATAAKPAVKVVGTGWSAVAVASAPTASKAPAGSQGQEKSLLDSLPKVSGPWGSGHLLDGTLFSAVVADDGRIAVGAVDPQSLYAALAAS